MTKKTPLKSWLATPGNTQARLATAVGITQGAVSQMLHGPRPREILVVESPDGIYLEEIRRIGRA